MSATTSPGTELSAAPPSPRLWSCPGYITLPALLTLFAATIGVMHFIVQPLAAASLSTTAASCGR